MEVEPRHDESADFEEEEDDDDDSEDEEAVVELPLAMSILSTAVWRQFFT